MEVPCKVDATFKATQHQLGDLQSPAPWSRAVLTYLGWHPYPGSWEGIDAGGDLRDIVIMEYADVPVAVRDWVDAQHRDKESTKSKWWLYGVFEKPKKDFGKASGIAMAPATPVAVGDDAPVIPDADKVLMFAPAALYEILPLWVAKNSGCEGESALWDWVDGSAVTNTDPLLLADMLDLSKYSSYARDKSVIAWPVEQETRLTGKLYLDLTFKIQAYYVLETGHGKTWREMWENLHVQTQRQARKEQREQRQAARGDIGRSKDEL